MKGDAYILVTGLVLAALANLPEIQSQECKFYGEIINESQANVNIIETIPKDRVILSLTTSPGYVNCSDLSSGSMGFSKYIGYRQTPTATDNKTLELFMAQAIGDDLDNGDINIVDQKYALLTGQCKLYCEQPPPVSLYITVAIEPENTKPPIFSRSSANLTLDENYPIDLDFSDLLIVNEQRLKVSDKDLPLEKLTFEVSDSRFKALEPYFRYYNDSKNQLRVEYEPRIAVNQTLKAEDSPITFNLIAKNNQTESNFMITINISPNDMHDPEFELPYYTSTIENSQFTGLLTVEQKNILAYDGDKKINQEIRYDITDKDGLEVSIKTQQPGKGVPIEIELTQPVEGSATDKMRYVVIKATQIDDETRYETVVLAVELPQIIVTTPTPTTAPTCPPCLTTSTASPTTTTTAMPCTTPTVPTCTPCPTVMTNPTTDAATSCPTFDPTTDCPIISTTNCPVCSSTTEVAQTTLYASTTSSTSPSSSTIITSTTAPVMSTTTEGTTSCSCPAYPSETVTVCPTECPTCPTECQTCPTECPTCPTGTTLSSSSASTETPSSTASTACPITCPEWTTASTSACECPTVTCPTTSTLTPENPTVHFDKQQYASELVENSPVQTFVVRLNAESTSADEQPEYSFAESYDTRYFSVDPKTGVVTTAQSLPIGNYSLEAIAEIRSGAKDYTRIIVSAVMGTLCGGTQFSSPLYEFPVAERTTGIVGQVELRSTEDTVYDLTIASCNPPSMIGSLQMPSIAPLPRPETSQFTFQAF
uniref:Putative Protocadherin-16/sw n=1 Tax=Daphnia magna TaxID=35525 RepID=A0A0P4XXE7_9CRUS